MPDWTCAAPGRAGFVCSPTLSDFSSDINGIAQQDAEARLDPNPDIAGQGVFVAFSLAFLFSTVLAILIHLCEASEIWRKMNNKKCSREDNPWLNTLHHTLDRILIAWSDQQLILGLATGIAAIIEWCSFSTYHVNIIKQWLIFCSATHVNALLVHCDYFSPNHYAANGLRVALIIVHTALTGTVVSDNGQTVGKWAPTIGDRTPLQALPAPCFFINSTRSATLESVAGWGSRGLRADIVFGISTALLSIALALLFVDLIHHHSRSSPNPTGKKIRSRPLHFTSHGYQWAHWGWRSALLAANLVIGSLTFHYTKELRSYMVDSKWLKDAAESNVTYGQFVPICLAVLVLFSALQGLADEIPDGELPVFGKRG